MVKIGLDLSINSTGICIDDNGKLTYYIVTSKSTKAYKDFIGKSNIINIIIYNKEEKGSEYSENEYNKTKNIYTITKEIEKILKQYNNIEIVRIEGVSYGSVGSSALVDLSGLQFMVRQMLIQNQIKFEIVSPTSNKKCATGNGQADKELMEYSWKICDKQINSINIPKTIKLDDIADAYFLAHYINS